MWPKVLMDLAPHLVKLVPAANRFLQEKSGSDDANREAMNALVARVHGDLGQVTSSHAGLYRQMNEQAEKIDRLGIDLTAARLAIESAEGRVARMQRRTNTLSNMLIASLVMTFLLMLMVFALLFRH